jgi:hypothetical protein
MFVNSPDRILVFVHYSSISKKNSISNCSCLYYTWDTCWNCHRTVWRERRTEWESKDGTSYCDQTPHVMQPNRQTHVAPFSTRGHSLICYIDVYSAVLSVSGILSYCDCRFVGLGGKLHGLVRTHSNFVLFSARSQDAQRLLTLSFSSVSPSVCVGGIFTKMYRLLPILVNLEQKSQTLLSFVNWYSRWKQTVFSVTYELGLRNNLWFIRLVIYETNTGNRISRPFRDKYVKLRMHCSYEPSWHLYLVSN